MCWTGWIARGEVNSRRNMPGELASRFRSSILIYVFKIETFGAVNPPSAAGSETI